MSNTGLKATSWSDPGVLSLLKHLETTTKLLFLQLRCKNTRIRLLTRLMWKITFNTDCIGSIRRRMDPFWWKTYLCWAEIWLKQSLLTIYRIILLVSLIMASLFLHGTMIWMITIWVRLRLYWLTLLRRRCLMSEKHSGSTGTSFWDR